MSSSRPPLFRAEAVAHYRRGPGAGRPVRFGRRWTSPGFLLMLALVAAGVGAAAFVRVPRAVEGPAVAGPGTSSIIAVLPVSAVSEIRRGRPLQLQTSAGRVTVRARSLDVQLTDRARAARTLGERLEGVTGDEVAVVRATLRGSRVQPGDSLRLRVALPDERLLSLLVTGFDGGGA